MEKSIFNLSYSVDIPNIDTSTLEGNVLFNFQNWANSYLKLYGQDNKEFIQTIYEEIDSLMGVSIYILDISTFKCGVKQYYTITFHDGNSYDSVQDSQLKVNHLNHLASKAIRFGNYLTDGDLLEPHITQVNDNMIQLTFFIC